MMTSQSSATVPLSFDSAPYFAALVAISCTIIDSTTATRGDNGTCGPIIRTCPALLSRYGCRTRPITSCSSEPCHFSLLSRLCASASAPSRPSNFSRSALLALPKVCAAIDCRIASIKHEADIAYRFDDALRGVLAVLLLLVGNANGRQ